MAVNRQSTTIGAQDDAATVSYSRVKREGDAIFQIGTGLVGTISFESSMDETTWDLIQAVEVSSGAPVTSVVNPGAAAKRQYRVVADGFSVRARCSAYTSGNCTILTDRTRS